MTTRILLAYERLSESTGFPAVSIAALSEESGVALEDLKDWLLTEHRNGNIVFALGDWSLASPEEREAAITVRGEKHLLVRLEGWRNWRFPASGKEILS
jgi:hypothetical protein